MSTELGQGEVILAIRPSVIRRGISILAILSVAVLFAAFAVTGEVEGAVWRALLVMAGVAMLALARRFFQATGVALELTRDEVRDSTGRVLFRLDEIEQIDRGILTMKPSNGLSVRLKSAGAFAWEPGLWWRIGKRIGIGGATAPSQARAIADAIALIQAEGLK